jgi:hypothetical protein
MPTDKIDQKFKTLTMEIFGAYQLMSASFEEFYKKSKTFIDDYANFIVTDSKFNVKSMDMARMLACFAYSRITSDLRIPTETIDKVTKRYKTETEQSVIPEENSIT